MAESEDKHLAFEKKAAELLDESVDRLDGATLSKLHQARSRALEAKPKSAWWGWQAWTGAGAVTASVALVVVLVQPVQQTPALPAIYEDPVQQATAEELELMDDLDFVAWLVLEESELVDETNAS